MADPRVHRRLQLRYNGGPETFALHLDGEPVTCVSRAELVFDTNGEAEAQLTVPTALLEIDVDAAMLIAANPA